MNIHISKSLNLSLLLIFCTIFTTYSDSYIFDCTRTVFVNTNNTHTPFLKKALDAFNIRYEEIDSIDTTNNNLHILFDIQDIDQKSLPKYYIAYQTLDLSASLMDKPLLEKLSNAVAVWDSSHKNIALYKNRLSNFHYFPHDYEHADPVILPCFLPTEALSGYKSLLEYENKADSDISSHLPTLYCFSILQNPRIMLELGISVSGQSTIAFKKCIDQCNAQIIGVDYLADAGHNYSNFKNGKFICMSDIDFGNHHAKNYSDSGFEIIFIDTSHEYLHTMEELKTFVPLLSENGLLIFHDSNVTPLNNNTMYLRLNGTFGTAHGNTRGVTQALKQFFSIQFDEYKYCNFMFTKNNKMWHLIHYPFCNGLTVIKNI